MAVAALTTLETIRREGLVITHMLNAVASVTEEPGVDPPGFNPATHIVPVKSH